MLCTKHPPHTLHSSEKPLILEHLWKYLSLTHISEDVWLIFELHSLELNLTFPSEFAENQRNKGLTQWSILIFITKKIKYLLCEALPLSLLALSSLFLNMQDSYSSTDIKLVLLNGFLVMHVQKASFASNLNFCFPLVTHFAASVFIL